MDLDNGTLLFARPLFSNRDDWRLISPNKPQNIVTSPNQSSYHSLGNTTQPTVYRNARIDGPLIGDSRRSHQIFSY